MFRKLISVPPVWLLGAAFVLVLTGRCLVAVDFRTEGLRFALSSLLPAGLCLLQSEREYARAKRGLRACASQPGRPLRGSIGA